MKRMSEVLKGYPWEKIKVSHDPMSPRYSDRAVGRREWLYKHGILLGSKLGDLNGLPELAFWAPSPRGARNVGYYCCLRLKRDGRNEISDVKIFCFYDGEDKGKAFRSLETALAFARDPENGFKEEPP